MKILNFFPSKKKLIWKNLRLHWPRKFLIELAIAPGASYLCYRNLELLIDMTDVVFAAIKNLH